MTVKKMIRLKNTVVEDVEELDDEQNEDDERSIINLNNTGIGILSNT